MQSIVLKTETPHSFFIGAEKFLEVPAEIEKGDLNKITVKWLMKPQVMDSKNTSTSQKELKVMSPTIAELKTNKIVFQFALRKRPSPEIKHHGIFCVNDVPLLQTEFWITQTILGVFTLTYSGGPFVSRCEKTGEILDSWWGTIKFNDISGFDSNQKYDLQKVLECWAKKKNNKQNVPVPYKIFDYLYNGKLSSTCEVKIKLQLKNNLPPFLLIVNDKIKLNQSHFEEGTQISVEEEENRIKQIRERSSIFICGSLMGGTSVINPECEISSDCKMAALKGLSFGVIEYNKQNYNLDVIISQLPKKKLEEILSNFTTKDTTSFPFGRWVVVPDGFKICGVKISKKELNVGVLG